MKQFIFICFAVGMVLSASTLKSAETPPSSAKLIEKGKSAYATNCVICHGEKGDGNGPAGAALNPKPRDFTKDPYKKGDKPEQVFQSISKGLEGTAMAAFGHLPEEDRWGLAYYVLSFNKTATKPVKKKK